MKNEECRMKKSWSSESNISLLNYCRVVKRFSEANEES